EKAPHHLALPALVSAAAAARLPAVALRAHAEPVGAKLKAAHDHIGGAELVGAEVKPEAAGLRPLLPRLPRLARSRRGIGRDAARRPSAAPRIGPKARGFLPRLGMLLPGALRRRARHAFLGRGCPPHTTGINTVRCHVTSQDRKSTRLNS